MAESTLIEIGLNDTLMDVVRKANWNFKRMSLDIRDNTSNAVADNWDDTEEGLRELTGALDRGLQQIQSALDEAERTLDTKIQTINTMTQELQTEITNLKNACPFDVGQIVMSNVALDLAKKYPGTRWTQLTGDRFIRFSSATPTTGGTNQRSITLSKSQLPTISGSVRNIARQSINTQTYCSGVFSAHPWVDGAHGYGTMDTRELGTDSDGNLVDERGNIVMDGFDFSVGEGQPVKFDVIPEWQSVYAYRRDA